MDAQSPTGPNITNEYTPQFYDATGVASGNGVSLSTFMKTIDKYTYSQDKINHAKLGTVDNSGVIKGNANIKGGEKVTHTHTTSIAAGNGVSAYAETDTFAKNSTEAHIGDINNTGKLSGELNQVSGDNSGYKSIHMLSRGISTASGNGVSSYAKIRNAQTKKAASTIGDIANKGKITGSAKIKAGNGSGDMTIAAKGSGNGVSSYLYADSISKQEPISKAGIGNVTNDGIITGHLETRAGINTGEHEVSAPNSLQEEVRLVVTDKNNFGSFNRPDVLPKAPSSVGSPSWNHTINNYTAISEIRASGNGISAYKGNPVDGQNKSRKTGHCG